MKLVPIPESEYESYRLELIFDAYKWDPQFLDSNTVAKYALVLTEREHDELRTLTQALDKETVAAERMLGADPALAKALSLPKAISRELHRFGSYEPERHIRLNRYDFHPVKSGGWAISEVNSDVPGGFAEASLMPQVALKYLETGRYRFDSFGEAIINALAGKAPQGAAIMLIHCTSYSDDRQVMQFLGDALENKGYRAIYAAADHLRFEAGEAISVLDGSEGKIDAIIRFTPLEWLVDMKPKRWQGYFDTTTVSCNHPIAVFAQTKRFPFVWEALERQGADFSAWRALLPETRAVRDLKSKHSGEQSGGLSGKPFSEPNNSDDFIYKPVLGRVGEGITIKEACREGEYKKTLKDVKKHPNKYLAQKKFISKPLLGDDGTEYHVCLGAFCVDGSAAGYYARISRVPRIDSAAADIPVLIEKDSAVSVASAHGAATARSDKPEPDKTTQSQPPANSGRDAYKVWANPQSVWSRWVRPVPFVFVEKEFCAEIAPSAKNAIYADKVQCELSTPCFYIPKITFTKINYLEKAEPDTAVFVDIPGYDGINEGLSLAKLGFMPVPLYNGTNGQGGAMEAVGSRAIECALLLGAALLRELTIPNSAPPAFLLDSNRLLMYKMNVSVFDNSWDIYEQDVPTADFLLRRGVSRVIVHGAKIHRDLAAILFKYQKKGLKILRTNGYNTPKEIQLRRRA